MAVEVENLKWTLDRICQSSRDADAKCGVVTAVVAALGAILFSNQTFPVLLFRVACGEVGGLSTKALFGVMTSALIVLVFALVATLFPRTKCSFNSKIYFDKIGRFIDWQAYKIDAKSYIYSFEDDLLSQIYVNSGICRQKHRWSKVALFATYVLVLSIIAFAVCQVMGW